MHDAQLPESPQEGTAGVTCPMGLNLLRLDGETVAGDTTRSPLFVPIGFMDDVPVQRLHPARPATSQTSAGPRLHQKTLWILPLPAGCVPRPNPCHPEPPGSSWPLSAPTGPETAPDNLSPTATIGERHWMLQTPRQVDRLHPSGTHCRALVRLTTMLALDTTHPSHGGCSQHRPSDGPEEPRQTHRAPSDNARHCPHDSIDHQGPTPPNDAPVPQQTRMALNASRQVPSASLANRRFRRSTP